MRTRIFRGLSRSALTTPGWLGPLADAVLRPQTGPGRLPRLSDRLLRDIGIEPDSRR